MNSEIREAQKRYNDFTGHDATEGRKVKVRAPGVGVEIGELDFVGYTTTRDGKEEKYIHRFRKRSKPTLAASSDGKSLHIVEGAYEFTERGIVDR